MIETKAGSSPAQHLINGLGEKEQALPIKSKYEPEEGRITYTFGGWVCISTAEERCGYYSLFLYSEFRNSENKNTSRDWENIGTQKLETDS